MDNSIKTIKGLGSKTFEYFKDAGILTYDDLILNYPKRYDTFIPVPLSSVKDDERITIKVLVTSQAIVKKFKKIENLIFYGISDNIKIKIIGFGKGYLRFNIRPGIIIYVNGYYSLNERRISAINVFFDEFKIQINPIYNIKNVSNYMYSKFVSQIIDDYQMEETLPYYLLDKYRLLNVKDYIYKSHFPQTLEDLRQVKRRRKYETYLNYHLKLEYLNDKQQTNFKEEKHFNLKLLNEFINSLPYQLTLSQMKALDDIVSDSKDTKVMNRLIQGDVGSGKTIIGIASVLLNYSLKYQSVVIAPTEILAKQHFKAFSEALRSYGVNVVLLTSQTKNQNKEEIIKGLEDGSIDLCVSTHAILYYKIKFKNFGLVVIDEQHRFGVNERRKLLDEYNKTDAIYFSATPIPRTLGLTKFKNMDITTLNELPKGRKTVKTKIFKTFEIDDMLSILKTHIKDGHQAFLVVPAISDEENKLFDIETCANLIREKINIDPLKIHGKLSAEEKDKVMLDFLNKKSSILISTTVIEVGIDIKNATFIGVFNAERFGLSTLHQLRGRVGRNNLDCFCALITDNEKSKVKILESTNDCFKIAETDFLLRGPGDFLGTNQSGFVDIDLENDINIYNCALTDAHELFKNKTDKIIEKITKELSLESFKLN